MVSWEYYFCIGHPLISCFVACYSFWTAPAVHSAPMNLQRDLSLYVGTSRDVHMVIETPRGSSLKLKYDEELKVFMWSRPLVAGISFPFDYGFLPQTLAGDGDAIDAMLLSDLSSYPGVVVPSRVIGALQIEQVRDGQAPKRNDRIMLLPCNDHRQADYKDMGDFPSRVRDELEGFCHASLLLTGKVIRIVGWLGAKDAQDLVAKGAQAYRQQSQGVE